MEGGGRTEVAAAFDEFPEVFCFLELDGREDEESFCFLEGTLGIVGKRGEGWKRRRRKEEVELNEILNEAPERLLFSD